MRDCTRDTRSSSEYYHTLRVAEAPFRCPKRCEMLEPVWGWAAHSRQARSYPPLGPARASQRRDQDGAQKGGQIQPPPPPRFGQGPAEPQRRSPRRPSRPLLQRHTRTDTRSCTIAARRGSKADGRSWRRQRLCLGAGRHNPGRSLRPNGRERQPNAAEPQPNAGRTPAERRAPGPGWGGRGRGGGEGRAARGSHPLRYAPAAARGGRPGLSSSAR